MRACPAPIFVCSLASLSGCGGGGSGANPPLAPNSVPLIVDLGPIVGGVPVGALNQAFVTVTVYSPDSTTACQTIDHIWVDTGSTGLRLVVSTLGNLSLPAVTDTGAANGNPLAECNQFVSSYTWGAIRAADVGIGGELARAIPIQVIGDAAFPSVPPSC